MIKNLRWYHRKQAYPKRGIGVGCTYGSLLSINENEDDRFFEISFMLYFSVTIIFYWTKIFSK